MSRAGLDSVRALIGTGYGFVLLLAGLVLPSYRSWLWTVGFALAVFGAVYGLLAIAGYRRYVASMGRDVNPAAVVPSQRTRGDQP